MSPIVYIIVYTVNMNQEPPTNGACMSESVKEELDKYKLKGVSIVCSNPNESLEVTKTELDLEKFDTLCVRFRGIAYVFEKNHYGNLTMSAEEDL